ncbi:UNVERIFIED_CONTAM: putative pumilio19 [Sesamum calycinum]|uniref:Pumilio19 n=1 Tax=Sesamum calycinum TaxID=2727403 RepID=A0AAW2KTD0_9LAMI
MHGFSIFSTEPTDHDVEEFIQYIECLRRGKYVGLRQAPTANSQSNVILTLPASCPLKLRKMEESLVSILEDSVFTLMLSRRLHYLYSMLVDECEGPQLDSLIGRVLSRSKCFLSAAFAKQGAISIIKLIRKVKKSSLHATAITRVLSTRFMDIMTHPTARDVILHCLILSRQPNEVLYEKVILHFHDLAIEKVGCGSLIYCIALIGGDQRVRLLDQIADVSDFLSYDPYGPKNEDVTKKITSRLQNEIMGLAKRRGVCLVVEKCMEASDDGIITVAMEILDSGRALLRLAGNQFGNYVIEAVLKKTKERGFNSLYNAIVRRLEVGRGGSAGRNKINSDAYIYKKSL